LLKHRSDKLNRVANALNKRSALLSIMTMEVVGLEEVMKLYEEDSTFVEA
jgi:hypothetical protein